MKPQQLAVITDPRRSSSCWSTSEVTTPDGSVRTIACGRGRHRFGRHRNRKVTWKCPETCGCVRHSPTERGEQ